MYIKNNRTLHLKIDWSKCVHLYTSSTTPSVHTVHNIQPICARSHKTTFLYQTESVVLTPVTIEKDSPGWGVPVLFGWFWPSGTSHLLDWLTLGWTLLYLFPGSTSIVFASCLGNQSKAFDSVMRLCCDYHMKRQCCHYCKINTGCLGPEVIFKHFILLRAGCLTD